MDEVRGVAPGFILLPAKDYSWKTVKRIDIRIPLEGKISGILNELDLADGVKIGGPDEFAAFDEDGTVYLWDIVRVLFADFKYPQLSDGQCLNVVALAKDTEANELIVYGEILESKEQWLL